MKKLILFLIGGALIAVGVFVFLHFQNSERVSLGNVNDAQKILMTLRRAQNAVGQTGTGEDLFARPQGGEVLYSKNWEMLRLPKVEVLAGFAYECLTASGFCQAFEIKKNVRTGNGIKIELGSGALLCLGKYQPVTTEGLDGKPVTVACQNEAVREG